MIVWNRKVSDKFNALKEHISPENKIIVPTTTACNIHNITNNKRNTETNRIQFCDIPHTNLSP
jgi:hypothetical protein